MAQDEMLLNSAAAYRLNPGKGKSETVREYRESSS
jgi:hypothetical protein